jgi:short subunit dehydrogenase-like uncharacterized protein
MKNTYLLYGAYGYTGQLIARFSEELGLKPILAGRNEEKLKEMSAEFGYDYLAFDLSDTKALMSALDRVEVVLHAAGPFAYTAKPMIEACIASKTHYLDITGEIEIFELAHTYDQAAKEAGVMIMPGTGFDVVPTDCMAKYLSKHLPDATHLELAFAMRGGGVSHGTAQTMVEGMGEGGMIRRDGKMTKVRLGHIAKSIPFSEDYERWAMAIPWGDVSTAYYTTGIPNIVTLTKVPKSTSQMAKLLPFVGGVLRMPWVRSILRKRVDAAPAGPSDEERATAKSLVWGQVRNEAGTMISADFQGPEGYTLTAKTSLLITRKVLNKEVFPGFQTPAGAYGENLIMEIPGTKRKLV